jgi:hypothetical protein
MSYILDPLSGAKLRSGSVTVNGVADNSRSSSSQANRQLPTSTVRLSPLSSAAAS